MSRFGRAAVRAAAAMALTILSGAAVANPVSAGETGNALHEQLELGKGFFVQICANCHGASGEGNTGPALAKRDLSQKTIAETVLSGRPGTPMPGFGDSFDTPTLAALVAYAQTLTSGGRLPTEPVEIASSQGAAVSATPVGVGAELGNPAAGAALFFDPIERSSCRACHSYNHKGGPIGPDLATLNEPPLAVFLTLTRARVPAADFPAVTLDLRDGGQIRGIEAGETSDALRLFDVTSIPPVLRSVPKSTIAATAPIKDAGLFDHAALPYSRQQRVDISAFVGQSGLAPTTR
jgi:mono/diheme cytochrome c family protein